MAATTALDGKLADIARSGAAPRLLLHCCCAPCASYVLEYLSPFFLITAFYYNPNIMPREEHDRRAGEFQKLLSRADYPNRVEMVVAGHDPGAFEQAASRYGGEPEGGLRCRACFDLRLEGTAKRAASLGFDYFATTLSVSPHKDAALLNEIGDRLAVTYGVKHLRSDFKKRDGFLRSVELSKEYGLYRQSYCGCAASIIV